MPERLSTNIKYLKGVGPTRAAYLTKLGIFSIEDLLTHYPRRYEDRSYFKPIKLLEDNEVQTFRATVVALEEKKPRRGLTLTKVTVRDDSAVAQLVWFNQSYLKNRYRPGMELIVYGKAERRFNIIQIVNPEVEIVDEAEELLNVGRIVPVYPATENINQRLLRQLVRQALADCRPIPEILPDNIIRQYNLVARDQALENIHFPPDKDALLQARRRLVFEELFFLQYGLLYLKNRNKRELQGIKHAPDGKLSKEVLARLPFALTTDQEQALQEIKADMEDTRPMQRLLQGDVGSGKTVIAALALVKTVENGYQGALMAPTEILAEQHFHTLSRLLANLGIRLALLTGRLTKRERDQVLANLRNGLVDIVIGTHALLQDDVHFKHLGLVVTDEQHRFGVRQRALLQAKGKMPDVLVMTATPIPRTMALTIYGDLDVSVIRTLPPGRKPIKTYSVTGEMRSRVYNFVAREVAAGRQAYVVCPLVEESDKLETRAAVQMYEQLARTHFKGLTCGLVHGKMKSQEKDAVMNAFYSGKIQVLIATTVIEVGVNVPNATVMVIEGADRFGLAQLHQLRGRIGRGEHQSFCILISDSKSEESKERLAIMTTTQDGFVLAEKDLLLRGPGQFFGTRQHGMPDLKLADIVRDIEILLEARQAAQQTVMHPEIFAKLQDVLKLRFGEAFNMIFNN